MSKDLGYHALAIAVPVFVHKSQGLLSRLCPMRVSDASFHDPVYDVEFLVTFDRVAVPMDNDRVLEEAGCVRVHCLIGGAVGSATYEC
jgi:hypothetical protein